MNKKLWLCISIVVQLYVLVFYYGYNKTLFEPPRSVHTWRQSDGASTGLHFYQYHNSIFKPMFHNMLEANGEAGSEFPLLYWLAAKLSPEHEFKGWYIRALCFAISVSFLLAINFISFSILGSVVQATYTSMLLFTSTVFVFYAGNYLPDVPAVCSGLIGCAFMYLYYKNRSITALLFAVVFFTLGGLLKITSIVPYLTLLSICFYELLTDKPVFNKSILAGKKFIILLIVPLVVSLAWIIYIRQYNELFNSIYYRTDTIPVWKLSFKNLKTLGGAIFIRWFHEYFSIVTVLIVVTVSIVATTKAWQKKRQHGFFLLLLILGSCSILVLFSSQFVLHDYYMIVVMQSAVFFYLFYFYSFGKIANKRYASLFNLGLIIYLLFDVVNTQKNIDLRYSNVTSWEDKWTLPLLEHRDSIYSKGISTKDKVVVIGDSTTCAGLYTLQTKGWTLLPDVPVLPSIEKYKSKGAKWAIVLPGNQHLEYSSTPAKQEFIVAGKYRVFRL